LEPTRIYVKPALAALKRTPHIRALAHITGGGFPDNLPRVLPKGLGVALDLSAFPVPRVFSWLAKAGEVAEAEMLRTFNCGIGMVVFAAKEGAAEVETTLRAVGEKPVRIGEVIEPEEAAERVVTTGKLAL
jgi:phosphoribosylformylglycinamidine cyclo-ligase